MFQALAIIGYLGAIVLANWSVATFGTDFIIINTFVLLAFDLTIRDLLHDRWHGKALKRNMALLIISGSALSALVNLDVARVALASMIAFAAAGVVDVVVYEKLFKRPRLLKINASNVFSALVDSIVFVVIVFGFTPATVSIIATAFVAKVAGGAVWSVILTRLVRRDASRYIDAMTVSEVG